MCVCVSLSLSLSLSHYFVTSCRLREIKNVWRLSLFPPFGDPWPSCLLPSQDQVTKVNVTCSPAKSPWGYLSGLNEVSWGRGYFTRRQPILLFLWVHKVSASSFIDGIIESPVHRSQRNRQDVLCMEPVGGGGFMGQSCCHEWGAEFTSVLWDWPGMEGPRCASDLLQGTAGCMDQPE